MRHSHATDDLLDLRILRHLSNIGSTSATQLTREVTGRSMRLRHRCSAMIGDGRVAFVNGAELTITTKGRQWLEDRGAAVAHVPTSGMAQVAELQAEIATLRGQLEDVTRLRDVHARHLQDVATALGPRFLSADCSFASAMQNLLGYVRGVEEEGGHYALLCQQAHDELDRAGVMSTGTPADRIRALLAKQAQAHKPESPRSTELEQYLARELLSELEENCDKSDPILRPLSMLRAIVTGEVPRG